MKKVEKHTKKHSKKGFSLIELLIVVTIILIIAAIAIPNLLRSRIAANEASAVASVHTLNTAEITYSSTYTINDKNLPGGFATLDVLGGTCSTTAPPTSSASCLIDNALAGATSKTSPKSGYYFQINGTSNAGDFIIGAQPATPGRSGVRGFCSTPDWVVRVQPVGDGSTFPGDDATCQTSPYTTL